MAARLLLLHMGKFGSDPQSVTKSLLTQANAMISAPVSIPEKPPIKEPQRNQSEEELTTDYHEAFRTP